MKDRNGRIITKCLKRFWKLRFKTSLGGMIDRKLTFWEHIGVYGDKSPTLAAFPQFLGFKGL